MKNLSTHERAQAVLHHTREHKPWTIHGKRVQMQLSLACLAVQNIDRILRETLYPAEIDTDIALALQALNLAEEALMDMELAQ